MDDMSYSVREAHEDRDEQQILARVMTFSFLPSPLTHLAKPYADGHTHTQTQPNARAHTHTHIASCTYVVYTTGTYVSRLAVRYTGK